MTSIRKASNPAMGWIIALLGTDYAQAATRADAEHIADRINARCETLTIPMIRRVFGIA
jgi:hypothetical protein